MLVIFDCDGVLVDSEPLSNRALAEALTAAGHPISTEETIAAFMGRSWKSCETLIRARFGAVPDGLADDYRERMHAAFEAELRPVEGVASAIDSIAAGGATTCVASSGDHAKMRHSLGLTGLLGRFEGRIFSATEVEHGKPAPDLFLHAAGAMGAGPADCVVVEDSPLGVTAARAAGMRVLGYAARTGAGALAGADATFTDMHELPALTGCAPRSAAAP
jgi:HAD superfamily hydrolase (TIGR01509 family)